MIRKITGHTVIIIGAADIITERKNIFPAIRNRDGTAGSFKHRHIIEAVAEAQAEVDENDPTGLRAKWHELFFDGAEGENADGDHFFFACDDSSNVTGATMMILNKDMTELNYYYLGNVGMEDDAMVIYDVDGENSLPFVVGDGEEAGTFTMTFKDGDVATMHYVDQDVIINDMVSVVETMNI